MQKSSEIFACQIKWVFFFVFCFANNVNLLLLRVEENSHALLVEFQIFMTPFIDFSYIQLSAVCNSLITENREGNGNPLQYSCLENSMDRGAWWAAVHGVAKSWTRLSDFTFTFHFHALEKEMATHSSILAWRIPGTAEPGGLPSMGPHRVGHDWSNLVVVVVITEKPKIYIIFCPPNSAPRILN